MNVQLEAHWFQILFAILQSTSNMKSNNNFVKEMGVVLKLMHYSILTMSETT
jgi:hypothetical protein